jgi:low affinity Fe/Cu permease
MTANTGVQPARPIGSQVLHLVDRYAGRTQVAVAVVIADVVWVLFSTVVGFPTRLETIFQTMVAALTLAMVFVIQHTQAREQVATQRKLDEILRAIPYADNALIAMEDADDDTLADTRRAHRNLRREAID